MTIQEYENRIAVLEAQLAHERALWEEVWKAYRMAEQAIARAHGFGEFRAKIDEKKEG